MVSSPQMSSTPECLAPWGWACTPAMIQRSTLSPAAAPPFGEGMPCAHRSAAATRQIDVHALLPPREYLERMRLACVLGVVGVLVVVVDVLRYRSSEVRHDGIVLDRWSRWLVGLLPSAVGPRPAVARVGRAALLAVVVRRGTAAAGSKRVRERAASACLLLRLGRREEFQS